MDTKPSQGDKFTRISSLEDQSVSKESIKSRLTRYFFNFVPVIRGTGMWISHIAADWRTVKVKLPLNIFTRNYVGTIFGGSIYSAVDPWYMLMIMKNLGSDYIVWDKAAHIKFIKPGKETIRAVFRINEELLVHIRQQVDQEGQYVIDIPVCFHDKSEIPVAEVIKTIYIADKAYYKKKKRLK